MLEVVKDSFLPAFHLDIADGPDGVSQYSKDLAFDLYTIPEPMGAVLMIVGGLGALALRRRA